MIDINELRRLAQAATPGPWINYGRQPNVAGLPHSAVAAKTLLARVYSEAYGDVEQETANASLIAAANPAAISEILNRLEAAESECLEQARLNGMGSEREAALMAKLEVAEKERDELRAENEALAANLRGKHSTTGATYAHLIEERDALRAKVAEMGKQEPVGEIRRANSTGNYNNSVVWVPMAVGAKLYALPGAQTQPTPRVPTALLVAVANLVAQMEIVSRVGFVDTPNDKDSCAAFCVAEGTWLELMSAVESLASALAAAPEAK